MTGELSSGDHAWITDYADEEIGAGRIHIDNYETERQALCACIARRKLGQNIRVIPPFTAEGNWTVRFWRSV
jgi:hypothetical protein